MPSQPARILIVDDVLENIQLLGSILREEGYRLNVAQSAPKALEILKDIKPDLILMDIMMPEMDGFEACRLIKANPDTVDIPLVFLSAKMEREDIIKGFELGAVDYATKPINRVELLIRIATHIELSRKTLALEECTRELRALQAKEKKTSNK